MANEFVQTMSDARIDARSLSEFVFKPANFTVTRRLAPSVRTLQYYIDIFDNLDVVLSSSVIAAQKSLNLSVAEAQGKVAYIESTVQDAINNTAIEGGVLADTFVTMTAINADGTPRNLRDVKMERVSVKDFGAKGDDNQTLYATNYKSDYISEPSTITQQTKDGLALNKAIRYLRGKGGGALYVPEGVYRVYGYLERIDFPCVIYGAGSSSLIKNCDNSPTDKNGYGILHMQPEVVSEITLMNLKLDGNGHVRTKPTQEWRSYNIHVCGLPQLRMFNVDSVNAVIDCLCLRYRRPHELTNEAGDYPLSCKFVNCNLTDSYRNTLTLATGNNVSFVNCDITGGGYVHNGINPRVCLDIEPTNGQAQNHVLNVTFTNCLFARAINGILGGTWGQAVFTDCTIDASHKHAVNANKKGYPWALIMSSIGHWTFNSCKIIGNKEDKETYCYHSNAHDLISDFAEEGGMFLNNTEFNYCGFSANGRRLEINNVTFKNSKRPFSVSPGNKPPQGDVKIRNLTLINVFETSTTTGTLSSFALNSFHKGNIDIDGLRVIVDKSQLLKYFTEADLVNRASFSGVTLRRGLDYCATNGYMAVAKNVHSEGYYQRINSILTSPKSNKDWGDPSLPPADTQVVYTANIVGQLVDGTVAENMVANTNISGTATSVDNPSSRVLGGRTTGYYQNCTMWGDYE